MEFNDLKFEFGHVGINAQSPEECEKRYHSPRTLFRSN